MRKIISNWMHFRWKSCKEDVYWLQEILDQNIAKRIGLIIFSHHLFSRILNWWIKMVIFSWFFLFFFWKRGLIEYLCSINPSGLIFRKLCEFSQLSLAFTKKVTLVDCHRMPLLFKKGTSFFFKFGTNIFIFPFHWTFPKEIISRNEERLKLNRVCYFNSLD